MEDIHSFSLTPHTLYLSFIYTFLLFDFYLFVTAHQPITACYFLCCFECFDNFLVLVGPHKINEEYVVP